jgi:hypothetical protein
VRLVRAAGAVAVVVAAFALLRPLPAGSDAPSATPAGRFGTEAAQTALLERLPETSECEAAELSAREVAALSCAVEGAATAGYALYEDVAQLREDWSERVEGAGFERDSTLGCQLAEGETAWHLGSDPFNSPGRILCFVDEEARATIEWTDERHLVLGYVVSDETDMAVAREVWRRAFLA